MLAVPTVYVVYCSIAIFQKNIHNRISSVTLSEFSLQEENPRDLTVGIVIANNAQWPDVCGHVYFFCGRMSSQLVFTYLSRQVMRRKTVS